MESPTEIPNSPRFWKLIWLNWMRVKGPIATRSSQSTQSWLTNSADCLDALDSVDDLAPQLGPSTQSDQSNSAQAILQDAVALGDFRIIRELGRGGMGIVYEAEQLSLRRRVALKVLPFAGVLDEQLLKDFKNESLAAATLDHPNIVQVHSVGCDRGVHYYAMQLIEGQSLAETITELRRIRKRGSVSGSDETADGGSFSAALASGSLSPGATTWTILVGANRAHECTNCRHSTPAGKRRCRLSLCRNMRSVSKCGEPRFAGRRGTQPCPCKRHPSSGHQARKFADRRQRKALGDGLWPGAD